MTDVASQIVPLLETAVVDSDTSCPIGWGQTTAKADNLGAFIQNKTWVLERPIDVVAVPLDRMAAPVQVVLPLRTKPERPPRYRKYRLEDLTAELRVKNKHDETDWGKPAGKEVW